MKLLIVEDSECVRRLIRRVAAQGDDEVYECSDGSEAPAAYARHRPDWVLMDLEMNGTDGLTATKEIKRIDAGAKIIIVTSYDEAALRDAAQEAGAQGYVLKEDLTDLRRTLNALAAR